MVGYRPGRKGSERDGDASWRWKALTRRAEAGGLGHLNVECFVPGQAGPSLQAHLVHGQQEAVDALQAAGRPRELHEGDDHKISLADRFGVRLRPPR